MTSVLFELQTVIADIVHEERDFRERTTQMRLDQQTMDTEHARALARLGGNSAECPHLAAHEAMFKVHRKMTREHSQALIHCRRLEEKYRRAQAGEQEVMATVRHLQSLLRRLQEEHRCLESERRKIVQEHSDFVLTLAGNH